MVSLEHLSNGSLDQIVKEQLNSEISVCLSLIVDDEILVSRLVKTMAKLLVE